MGTGTREQGLGDVGLRMWDAGTRGRGTLGRGTWGLRDVWRLGDVINKPDFWVEFVKYNFRWS